MKRLLTIIITILIGVFLHFIYEWSGKNTFAALIGAVNESTWEHLKLLFFPFLFVTIIEYFLYKPDFRKFFSARCIGLLYGIMAIVVIFYTYKGIYKNVDLINIALFILAVFISFFVSDKMFKKTGNILSPVFSIGILFILTLMFFVFTFYPPDINLFKP